MKETAETRYWLPENADRHRSVCKAVTFNFQLYIFNFLKFAGMVELVDSVDLGSTAKSVQVRVLLPAPETPSARAQIRDNR